MRKDSSLVWFIDSMQFQPKPQLDFSTEPTKLREKEEESGYSEDERMALLADIKDRYKVL